jgi:hypothetical protein
MKTLLPHTTLPKILLGLSLCFSHAFVNGQALDSRFKTPTVVSRTYFTSIAELSTGKIVRQ